MGHTTIRTSNISVTIGRRFDSLWVPVGFTAIRTSNISVPVGNRWGRLWSILLLLLLLLLLLAPFPLGSFSKTFFSRSRIHQLNIVAARVTLQDKAVIRVRSFLSGVGRLHLAGTAPMLGAELGHGAQLWLTTRLTLRLRLRVVRGRLEPRQRLRGRGLRVAWRSRYQLKAALLARNRL